MERRFGGFQMGLEKPEVGLTLLSAALLGVAAVLVTTARPFLMMRRPGGYFSFLFAPSRSPRPRSFMLSFGARRSRLR